MNERVSKLLEIKNLSKMLGERLIIRNVSLTLNKGETLAVIGPNGAGKSTFFKCTAGLLKPTNGDIFFNGEHIKKNSVEMKQKIGFLGHEAFLYPTLTPMENLTFYGKLYKVKDIAEKSNQLLKKVGLHFVKDMPVRSFSRGMVQRLAIARVLLPEPEILLLDEPHTGLDQSAVSLLNSILLEKKSCGTSILLISHDFEQVHALADRAVILKKGKMMDERKMEAGLELSAFKRWYERMVLEG